MPHGAKHLALNPRAVAAVPASSGPAVVHCRKAVQIDYQTRALQGQEGTSGQPGGGIVRIQLPLPQPNQHYVVEKVYVDSDSTNAWTTTLGIGDPTADSTAAIEGASGQGTYSEQPGLLVPAGIPFTVVFDGLSAEAVCTARIQYQVWLAYSAPMALP